MQVVEKPKPISGGKHAVKRIAQARRDFGGVCAWNGCTITTGLQFAHVHGFEVGSKTSGRGSCVRIQYITKTPAFVKLLCTKHHMKYDEKKSSDKDDPDDFDDNDDEEDF